MGFGVRNVSPRLLTAELLSIAVAEDTHRMGLGSMLITKVIDFMKENRVPKFPKKLGTRFIELN